MLDVKNIERQSVLLLGCADGVGQRSSLHIGEQTTTWNLQQLSPDQLFLAFDTTGVPAGCTLQAVIDNQRGGSSRPFTLAHIIRVPQIDSFTPGSTPPQNSAREYHLTGRNLEMIDKLGWDNGSGVDVTGLPVPLPGPGLKQSIQINLPEAPGAEAPLYVWLRGDNQGRATTIKAPVPPPQATITLTSSLNPSCVGQPVTFMVKVEPPTATGTINFMNGQNLLGSSTLSAGQATFTTSSLPEGALSVTALYSSDAKSSPSISPALMQTVRSKAATSISVKATPNPSAAGQEVMLTAVVAVTSPEGVTATGTVAFMAGDTNLGTSTVDSAGTAVLRTSTLAPGKYELKAIYSGAPTFAGSTSDGTTQVVQ
jgi:hypothetical protein